MKILSNAQNQVVQVIDDKGTRLDATTERKYVMAQAKKEFDACTTKQQVVLWLKRFRMTGYGSLVKEMMLAEAEATALLEITELPSE